MAEDIKLKIELDSKQATKSANDMATAMDNLSKETGKADKEIKDLDNTAKKAAKNPLEERLNTLNKTVKESPVNIRAMNRQIQEYQAIALEAGRNSPIGKAALAEAANMRDRYVDIQNEVKRLSNDGVKLQAALDLGTSVVAGFTAVKGATALLGVENENLQETMVKLQAAQSVLVGVETIRKNLEKESTLTLIAKNTAEKISLASTKALTAAQKALNLSFLASPIGLITIGVAALGAAFIAFKDQILGAVMPAINAFTDALEDVGQFFGLIESDAEKAAKAQEEAADRAAKAEIEKLNAIADSLEKERALRTKTINQEIELRKAAGEETIQLEEEKLLFIIKSIREEQRLRDEAFKKEIERAKKQSGSLGVIAEATAKANKEIRDTAANEELADTEFQLKKLRIERKKAADDEKKARAKERQDAAKAQADANAKELEARAKQLEELRKLEIENIEDDERREVAKIENDAKLRVQAAQENIKDAEILAATLEQIQITKNNKLLEIDQKFREQEAAQEKEAYLKRREEIDSITQTEIDTRRSQLEALKSVEVNGFMERLTQIQELEAKAKELEVEQYEQNKEELLQRLEDESITQAEFDALQQQQLEAHQQTLTDITSQAAKDRTDAEIQEAERKAAILQQLETDTFTILTGLIDIGIKNEERAAKAQKALAVAQIAIDTAKGISAAVAAGAGLPFPTNIPAILSGVAAVVSGIASAKKALGTAGSVQSPNIQTPSTTTQASQGVDINSVNSGSTLLQPTKQQVVVLETDISQTQGNIASVEQTATVD